MLLLSLILTNIHNHWCAVSLLFLNSHWNNYITIQMKNVMCHLPSFKVPSAYGSCTLSNSDVRWKGCISVLQPNCGWITIAFTPRTDLGQPLLPRPRLPHRVWSWELRGGWVVSGKAVLGETTLFFRACFHCSNMTVVPRKRILFSLPWGGWKILGTGARICTQVAVCSC